MKRVAAAAAATVLVWTGAASASADPISCSAHYDDAAKAEVVSLLRGRYGDADRAYDIDHPEWVLGFSDGPNYDVVETPNGKVRIDPYSVYWRGFSRKSGRRGVPRLIEVAFERCSNSKLIGYKTFE